MASASPAPQNHSFLRKHGAKLLASAIITIGILYTLKHGGIKFVPEGGSFNTIRARWWVVLGYLATFFAFSYFRATRWRFLLRSMADVPRRRVLAVSWIGFAAILLMPFRIGEFVRPYMIRDSKGKISLTAATGTVLAERIVDGLYLSIVVAVAYWVVPLIEPLPKYVVGLKNLHVTVTEVRASGYAMFGLFATAFVVIVIFYFARAWGRKATLAVIGIVSKPLAEKLADFATKLADGLHFLGRARDAIPFLLETTAYWVLNAFGMWLLAWGCGVVHADGSAPTFGEACALMGTLGVTILIPGPPGLLGVFQLGIFAGMTMFYPESIVTAEGAAYVFLLYGIQFIATLICGGLFLLGDRKSIRELEEAEGVLPPTPPHDELASAEGVRGA